MGNLHKKVDVRTTIQKIKIYCSGCGKPIMKGQTCVIVDYKNVRNDAYGTVKKFCDESCAPLSYTTDTTKDKKKLYLRKDSSVPTIEHVPPAEKLDRLLKVRNSLIGRENVESIRMRFDRYGIEINEILNAHPELRHIVATE